jgi:hypothetical protein
MSNFDVEMVGDKPGDIEERLTVLGSQGQTRTNRALLESAQDVQKSLEKTSPVDTGEYQSSWYIFQAAEDEVWILNEAEHAKFVMLPNQLMVNSGKADLPASGILHDVKGIAREHQKTLHIGMADEIKRMIKSFRVR